MAYYLNSLDGSVEKLTDIYGNYVLVNDSEIAAQTQIAAVRTINVYFEKDSDILEYVADADKLGVKIFKLDTSNILTRYKVEDGKVYLTKNIAKTNIVNTDYSYSYLNIDSNVSIISGGLSGNFYDSYKNVSINDFEIGNVYYEYNEDTQSFVKTNDSYEVISTNLSNGTKKYYVADVTVKENKDWSVYDYVLTDKVNRIGSYMLYNTYLNKLDFSNFNITELASYSCAYNRAVTEIIVPKTVKTMERSCFEGCINVKTITIPFVGKNRDVQFVDQFVGQDSSVLALEMLGSGIPGTNFGSIFGLDAEVNYDDSNSYKDVFFNIETVTVTDAKKLSNGAFSLFKGIKNINLNNEIEEIGRSCFAGCTGLENINIPNMLKRVNAYTFTSCISLKNISFSKDSKTEVDSTAFTNCYQLQCILEDGYKYLGGKFIPSDTTSTKDQFYKEMVYNKLLEYSEIYSNCDVYENQEGSFVKTSDDIHTIQDNINNNTKDYFIQSYVFKPVSKDSAMSYENLFEVDDSTNEFHCVFDVPQEQNLVFPHDTKTYAIPLDKLKNVTSISLTNLKKHFYSYLTGLDTKDLLEVNILEKLPNIREFVVTNDVSGDCLFYGLRLSNLVLPSNTKTIGFWSCALNLDADTVNSIKNESNKIINFSDLINLEEIKDFAFGGEDPGYLKYIMPSESDVPNSVKKLGRETVAATKKLQVPNNIEELSFEPFYFYDFTEFNYDSWGVNGFLELSEDSGNIHVSPVLNEWVDKNIVNKIDGCYYIGSENCDNKVFLFGHNRNLDSSDDWYEKPTQLDESLEYFEKVLNNYYRVQNPIENDLSNYFVITEQQPTEFNSSENYFEKTSNAYHRIQNPIESDLSNYVVITEQQPTEFNPSQVYFEKKSEYRKIDNIPTEETLNNYYITLSRQCIEFSPFNACYFRDSYGNYICYNGGNVGNSNFLLLDYVEKNPTKFVIKVESGSKHLYYIKNEEEISCDIVNEQVFNDLKDLLYMFNEVITVPEGTVCLDSYALSSGVNTNGISTLKLPSTLKSIGYQVFHYAMVKKIIVDSIKTWFSIKYPDNFYSIAMSDVYPFEISWDEYILKSENNPWYTAPFCILGIPIGSMGSDITKETVDEMKRVYSNLNELVVDGKTVTEIDFRKDESLNSITHLYPEATYGLTTLRKIVLPENLDKLYACQFMFCTGLETVVIPDTITEIPAGCFCGCLNLRDINIPNTITTISSAAFANCFEFEKIILPDHLNIIEDDAFGSCVKLQKVVMGIEVTKIGLAAFDACHKNFLVYYKGTKEMWNNINIVVEEYHGKYAPEVAFYSESKPADLTETKYWRFVNNEPVLWEEI